MTIKACAAHRHPFPTPSQQSERPELSRHRRESSLLQPHIDPLVRSFAAVLDPVPSFVPR